MTTPGEPGGKVGQLSREERARLYEKLRQKKSAAPAVAAADDHPLAAVRRDPAGLPLSFSQERLWLLDRLTPGTEIYNLPLAVRLRGPLDPAILARCFTEVSRRHEILRTTSAFLAQAQLDRRGQWYWGTGVRRSVSHETSAN